MHQLLWQVDNVTLSYTRYIQTSSILASTSLRNVEGFWNIHSCYINSGYKRLNWKQTPWVCSPAGPAWTRSSVEAAWLQQVHQCTGLLFLRLRKSWHKTTQLAFLKTCLRIWFHATGHCTQDQIHSSRKTMHQGSNYYKSVRFTNTCTKIWLICPM